MIFLSDDENGEVCGMISKIRKNQQNKFVSIQHLGLLEKGEEIMKGPKVDPFSGALEEYTFEVSDTTTILKIRMDALPEWEEYFLESWPKALEKLKAIVESNL